MIIGADIHTYVEVRKNGAWEAVKGPYRWLKNDEEGLARAIAEGDQDGIKYYTEEIESVKDGVLQGWVYSGRNYLLFGILADVRTPNGVLPFSDGNGLPKNLTPEIDAEWQEGEGDWHTPTHYTLETLLKLPWRERFIEDELALNLEGYKKFCNNEPYESMERWQVERDPNWVELSPPLMGNILSGELITQEGINYYTVVCDKISYWDAVSDFTQNTIPKLQALIPPGGTAADVRFIFWFDN